MSTLKKIFFFSLFALFLSLLFWGIYVLSFKKTIPVENKNIILKNSTEPITQITDKIMPASKEKISLVLDEALVSPTLSSDKEHILYYSTSGELKETDFFGSNQKSLTSKKIVDLSKAIWSPDKSKVLLKTKTNSFSFFDIKNDRLIPLNNNINEVAWQAGSNKIFYKYFDANNKKSSLNVSDSDGSNWKQILDLPHDKITFFQIPRSGLVSLWNNPDAYYPTNFQTASLIGENLKTITQGYFGADYLWDNAGNFVLTSQSDQKGGQKIQLGVMNYNGEGYRNLGLPTFVSKCSWSKNNELLYCALPGEIPTGSVLPNDYMTQKFTTADTFWKINVATGEKTRLVETNDIKSEFDATNLFSNNDESLLFFVNRKDNKLYKIVL